MNGKTKGYFNKCYFNAYKKIQEYYYPVHVYFDDTLIGHERELWIHDLIKKMNKYGLILK